MDVEGMGGGPGGSDRGRGRDNALRSLDGLGRVAGLGLGMTPKKLTSVYILGPEGEAGSCRRMSQKSEATGVALGSTSSWWVPWPNSRKL